MALQTGRSPHPLPGPCFVHNLFQQLPLPPPQASKLTLRIPSRKEDLGAPFLALVCIWGEEGYFVSSRVRVLAWLGGVGYRHFIWVRGGSR